MRNDTRERNQWKVRITDCVNQSSDVISQPVSKRMAEVMVGISGSGLVRAANQRHWLWRRSWGTAQQIARQLPLKHRGKLKKQSRDSLSIQASPLSLYFMAMSSSCFRALPGTPWKPAGTRWPTPLPVTGRTNFQIQQ